MIRKRGFYLFLIMGICLVSALRPVTSYASGTINRQIMTRLNGANRYQTAIAVSNQGWDTSQAVVLANGYEFTNALAGVTLAYSKNAPILLTDKEAINNNTLQEINRLKAKDIYIVGGTDSISSTQERSLKSRGFNIERIDGTDKFKTATAIGDKVISLNSKVTDTVFISNVDSFPDALSASTFAARNGYPILFTGKDSLNEDTKKAIERWGIKNAYVLGGTGVISPTVETSLKALGLNTTRLQGNNRYETAMNVLKQFDKGDFNGLTLTSGLDFPDALAGSVIAAKENAPVMVYNSQSVNSAVATYVDSKGKNFYVLGGEGAVPTQDIADILNHANIKKPVVTAAAPVISTPVLTSSPQFSVADINDAWRTFYLRLERGPSSYHGARELFFDNMTKAIADGSLSKEAAEAQLKSMDFWKETDTSSCKVGTQHIVVYETSTNNLKSLISEINNGLLFAAGTYSNSYVYYDSKTGKNRIVMVGINFITRIMMQK